MSAAETLFEPIARRRSPRAGGLPRIAALWMERTGARTARIELRIDRAAATPDWVIRRIEWLAPAQAAIAGAADGRPRRVLDVALRPGDARGLWFAEDPSLWVRYAEDAVPVHQACLRLDIERAGGHRSRLDVQAVFPALSRGGEVVRFEPRFAEAGLG